MPNTILTTLFIIVTVQIVQCLHYPQYFQAFSLKHCMGPPMDFLDATTNMTLIPELKSAKSISARGLWQIKAGGSLSTVFFSHNARVCSEPQIATNPLDYAIRLVIGDLDDSVLNLYTEKEFSGELRMSARPEVRFAEPFQIASWAFTGAQNFTIYEGNNFTGKAVCLVVEKFTKDYGWGLTYEYDATSHNLIGHSVRFGCDPSANVFIQGEHQIENNGSVIYESKDEMDFQKYI